VDDLGARPTGSPPVWVDHVEWLPTDGESGLLRVRGRFGGPAPPTGQPSLVAMSGEERRALEPLPERLPPEPPVWRAAFVAPAGLLVPAPEGLWLEWPGGPRAAVPVPAGIQPPPERTVGRDSPGGELVDRAVLAERRARRAEAAEQEQGRIAAEALKAVEALELRAREVEQRLEAALRERDVLTARVRRLEDELAAAPPAPPPTPPAPAPQETLNRLTGALEAVARLRAEVARLRAALRVSETGRAQAAVRLAADARRLEPGPPVPEELEARAREADRRARDLRAELTRVRAEVGATRIAAAAGRVAQARVVALERERMRAAAPDTAPAAAPPAAPAPAPPPAPQRLAERAEELAERAEELGRPAPKAPEAADAQALAQDLDAAALRLKRDLAPQPAPPPPPGSSPAPPPPRLVTGPRRTWSVAPLRLALIELAHQDPRSAARLLVGLLPAQAAVIDGPLSYDLTLRELGTFAVSIEHGRAEVRRIASARPRARAAFHLTADALTLAELGADARTHRIGRRFGRVRASGRRTLLRVLEAVPAAAPALPAAMRLGARVEPVPALRLLTHLVPTAWTRGHAFSVACRVGDETATLTASDGRPLRVASAAAPDAAVTMSPAAWERLLRGELQRPDDPLRITGDARAVGRLGEWALRAGVPLATQRVEIAGPRGR
jgi:hypothetical protein